MNEDQAYKELVLNWRHFLSWRDKLFGGYLATLAALTIGCFQAPSATWRVVILVAAVIVSIVFWLLDFRTSQFVYACQREASKRPEDKGVFAALREADSNRWLTYGFAHDLLVGGATSAAVTGAIIYWKRVPTGTLGNFAPLAGIATLLVIVIGSQTIRHREWKRNKNR